LHGLASNRLSHGTVKKYFSIILAGTEQDHDKPQDSAADFGISHLFKLEVRDLV
jgi:hypothetical protein